MKRTTSSPSILDRLRIALGSQNATARALGVSENYPTRWRKEGFIPESYALDVGELKISDEYGRITAMDVLVEAREMRRLRLGNSG